MKNLKDYISFSDEFKIKKMHKAYGKRKIQVYKGNKLFGEISEFWHWISLDLKNKNNEEDISILRRIAMENLWWLLHTDNLDPDDEFEEWEEKINRWDKGIILGKIKGLNKQPSSNFLSKEEKEIALNSINNK